MSVAFGPWCPSEYSVSLLATAALPPGSDLLWSSLLVQRLPTVGSGLSGLLAVPLPLASPRLCGISVPSRTRSRLGVSCNLSSSFALLVVGSNDVPTAAAAAEFLS